MALFLSVLSVNVCFWCSMGNVLQKTWNKLTVVLWKVHFCSFSNKCSFLETCALPDLQCCPVLQYKFKQYNISFIFSATEIFSQVTFEFKYKNLKKKSAPFNSVKRKRKMDRGGWKGLRPGLNSCTLYIHRYIHRHMHPLKPVFFSLYSVENALPFCIWL